MTYCRNCGKELPGNGAAYCPNCGSATGAKQNESFTDRLEQEADKFMNNKEPFISAILSFFWPGLGQVYNGDFKKGLLIQIIYIISWIAGIIFFPFLLIPPAVLVCGIYDGYTEANKMRKGAEALKNPTLKEILIFLLWPFILAGGLILAFILVILADVVFALIVAFIAAVGTVIFNTALLI